ncbi:MAG: MFS transporter [Cyclobacteriaceae bacterium]
MLAIQKKLTNSFYALLALPATAMGFALSVQISALSWILSTKYGLKIDEIGLVWAAGPIAGIFGQIIVGLISDNVWFWGGRRKPFILIGGVIAALMLLALPSIDIISTSLGFEGILAVAIAVALSLDLAINISFNPTRSVIADVTPEGTDRTKGYTWMQTISGTFGVLAYFIGAVWNNYVLIYFGVGLVFLFSFVPPFFIEEPRNLQVQTSKESGKSYSIWAILKIIQPLWGFLLYGIYGITMKIIRGEEAAEPSNYYVEYFLGGLTVVLIIQALARSEKGKSKEEAGAIGFKKILAAHAFTWVGVQSMFIYMFPYVQQKLPELSELDGGKVISWSFLVFNLVGALLPAFVLEPMTERIGRVKTHTICIGIMAAGYAGILFFGFNQTVIYIFMAVVGVGWAATVSLPFAIMSQKINPAKMGLYMGLFNLSVVLPQLVASLGIGIAMELADNKSLLFIICALSLAASAVAWMFVTEDEADGGAPAAPASGGH